MRIDFRAGRHDYCAVVESGCVTGPSAGARLEGLQPETTLVVADRTILELHPGLPVLRAGARPALALEASERLKTLEGATGLMRTFLEAGVTRAHTIVAVGGGTVQDAAGFACCVYLRGLRWWLLPTTLLAQADSCVGSKTSINFDESKNLLGTFYPPHRILIDPLLLRTLERRDLLSGLGEVLKVHCMKGGVAFGRLERDWGRLLSGEPAAIAEYIVESLRIKGEFIEGDEYDRGRRQLLNYGHCFGHALEAATEFAVPHGIAVAAGILFANDVSARRGLLDGRERGRMDALARSLADPRDWPRVEAAQVLRHLKRDKKREGAQLAMILSRGLGRTERYVDVTEREFEQAFAACRSAAAAP